MSLNVPPDAYKAMRDGKQAWNRLVQTVKKHENTWTDEQREQLHLITELAKQHHTVLLRLIEANK